VILKALRSCRSESVAVIHALVAERHAEGPFLEALAEVGAAALIIDPDGGTLPAAREFGALLDTLLEHTPAPQQVLSTASTALASLCKVTHEEDVWRWLSALASATARCLDTSTDLDLDSDPLSNVALLACATAFNREIAFQPHVLIAASTTKIGGLLAILSATALLEHQEVDAALDLLNTCEIPVIAPAALVLAFKDLPQNEWLVATIGYVSLMDRHCRWAKDLKRGMLLKPGCVERFDTRAWQDTADTLHLVLARTLVATNALKLAQEQLALVSHKCPALEPVSYILSFEAGRADDIVLPSHNPERAALLQRFAQERPVIATWRRKLDGVAKRFDPAIREEFEMLYAHALFATGAYEEASLCYSNINTRHNTASAFWPAWWIETVLASVPGNQHDRLERRLQEPLAACVHHRTELHDEVFSSLTAILLTPENLDLLLAAVNEFDTQISNPDAAVTWFQHWLAHLGVFGGVAELCCTALATALQVLPPRNLQAGPRHSTASPLAELTTLALLARVRLLTAQDPEALQDSPAIHEESASRLERRTARREPPAPAPLDTDPTPDVANPEELFELLKNTLDRRIATELGSLLATFDDPTTALRYNQHWLALLGPSGLAREALGPQEADVELAHVLIRLNRQEEAAAVVTGLFWRSLNANDHLAASKWAAWAEELGNKDPREVCKAALTQPPKEGTAPVRILFVGGNETQARMQPSIEAAITERYQGRVVVVWFNTGWSSNWGAHADRVEAALPAAHGMVMMRFIRTNLGHRLRGLASQHDVPWVACTGHGQKALTDAIVRLVTTIDRLRAS
jgi:hypothetical protein